MVRSWRCQTQRTPAGEIDSPRLASSLETRTWPQAGCSIAISTTASSISGAVRFFRIGLRRLISCKRQLAAFVVQLLEPVEAVAAVAHHLAGLADIAELLGQLQQPDLGSDDLLFLGHGGLRPAGGRVAVPARGENRAPPPGSASETNTDCQVKFELPHIKAAHHAFCVNAGDDQYRHRGVPVPGVYTGHSINRRASQAFEDR